MVPLGTAKSLGSIARSLPNGHTHQTYDWGGSNAKFRMQKCAWCCLDKDTVFTIFWPWSPLGDAIYKQRPRLAGAWCIAAESRASLARVPLAKTSQLVNRADRREVPWMAGFRCAHRRSHLKTTRGGTPCGRLHGRLLSRAPRAELERRAARAAMAGIIVRKRHLE